MGDGGAAEGGLEASQSLVLSEGALDTLSPAPGLEDAGSANAAGGAGSAGSAGPPGGGSAEDRDPLESSSFALEDELAALKSPTAGESSLELSASRGHGLEFSANIASVEGSQDLDQNYDVVESVEM